MIVYWSMFAIPALLAVLLYQSQRRVGMGVCALILAAFFFLMAFRETGGDYYTYELFYRLMENKDFAFVTGRTDYLYGVANWISARFDGGMTGVNIICSIVFLVSFFMFVRHEPYPLLSLAVATAYLIIVVAIGYTRQGVAAGLLLWGTVYLRRRLPMRYLVLQVLAIGFHTSAAFGLVFIYFALNFRREIAKQVVFAGLALGGALIVFIQRADVFDGYMIGYIENIDHYNSDGAAARLAMSFLAAVVFFVIRRWWPESDRRIWTAYAVLTLALLPVLAISTTIADRLGLYTIALQVAVFGRLPMFGQSLQTRIALFLGVLLIYATALGVWLHVGNFAKVLWLPYQSSLFGTIA